MLGFILSFCFLSWSWIGAILGLEAMLKIDAKFPKSTTTKTLVALVAYGPIFWVMAFIYYSSEKVVAWFKPIRDWINN